jgi:hypothetical protein
MPSCAADREDAIPPRLRTRTLAVNRECRPSAICYPAKPVPPARCFGEAGSPVPGIARA